MARIAAAGFALLLAATPSAAAASSAGEGRTTLSVSAIVAPSCRIDRRDDAASHAVACSAGTAFSTSTVAHRDEKPLREAAAILGAPARGARGIEFAAPIRAAAATLAQAEPQGEAATRYLTITY